MPKGSKKKGSTSRDERLDSKDADSSDDKMSSSNATSNRPTPVNSKGKKRKLNDDGVTRSDFAELGESHSVLQDAVRDIDIRMRDDVDRIYKDIENTRTEVRKAAATLRVVHRDLVFCDLRVTNVPHKVGNVERDPVGTWKDILELGLKMDKVNAEEMCKPERLLRARWVQNRTWVTDKTTKERKLVVSHALILRLASERDVKQVFELKKAKTFKDYKYGGCDKAVSINRNYTPEDRFDQLRCRTVAQAYCDKLGLSMKNDITLMGKAFKVKDKGVKPWEDWLKAERLVPDPRKMGDNWVQPFFEI